MKKGLIFDLDGTLWDSAPNVTRAFNSALLDIADFRVQINDNDMRGFMGNLLFDIGKKMLPKNLSDSRVEEIIGHCCEVEHDYLLRNGAPLYEYLGETLEKLKKEYSLYIVSNCQAGYIEVFLEHFGFWNIFDDYECPGRTGLLKADNIRLVISRNNIEKAFYIGDTDGDFCACEKADVPFIHAAYGYGRPHLRTPYVSRFCDLADLLL